MQVNASDGGDRKEGSVVVRKRSRSDRKEGSVGFGKRCRSSKSSSDLQEDELEKSPCLFGYTKDGPVLYCFNLEEKSQSKRNFCRRCCADLFGERKAAEEEDEPPEQIGVRLLTPPPPSDKSGLPPHCSMTVSVGGTVVYTLGGSYKDPEKEGRLLYSNKVFYFDTDHPQKGWMQGPDMLNKRHDGKAVVVDGKIFVFAGVNYKDKDKKKARHPWAECLDTKKNEWEAIPSPPKSFGLHMSDLSLSFAPVVCGRKILFGCCDLIYHVDARCWEEFEPKLAPKLSDLSGNLVALGNKLYWTYEGIFCTFDLTTEEKNRGSIEGYPMTKYKADLLLPEPALLHLGGSHFCLLTLKDIRLDPTTTTKVCCTKFRVPDEGDFRGSVVCRETFVVPHALSVYNSCAFVMDGKLVRMKKDGVVFD